MILFRMGNMMIRARKAIGVSEEPPRRGSVPMLDVPATGGFWPINAIRA
jgi:hypothetical protein